MQGSSMFAADIGFNALLRKHWVDTYLCKQCNDSLVDIKALREQNLMYRYLEFGKCEAESGVALKYVR